MMAFLVLGPLGVVLGNSRPSMEALAGLNFPELSWFLRDFAGDGGERRPPPPAEREGPKQLVWGWGAGFEDKSSA